MPRGAEGYCIRIKYCVVSLVILRTEWVNFPCGNLVESAHLGTESNIKVYTTIT